MLNGSKIEKENDPIFVLVLFTNPSYDDNHYITGTSNICVGRGESQSYAVNQRRLRRVMLNVAGVAGRCSSVWLCVLSVWTSKESRLL